MAVVRHDVGGDLVIWRSFEWPLIHTWPYLLNASVSDRPEARSLRIGQPEPGWQVASEDAVLRCQVFVSQQQFLVDEARDKGQKAGPVDSIAHGKGPS